MDSTQQTVEVSAGERLRRIRKEFGLTIKGLANMLGEGVHFTTISKLERGTMSLTIEWADRFAKALNINPLDLLSDNYAQRQWRSVPLYFWYSWTPEKGILGAKQLGWIPTMSEGGLEFGLGFYPSKDYEDNSGVGLNYVIDPSQRQLVAEKLYVFYLDEETGPLPGTFRLDPPRFVLIDGGGDVVLGEQPFYLAGRVVFQCRLLE